MPKLSRTPDLDRLANLEPELAVLEPGILLYRIYFRTGPFPTTWRAFRRFGPVSRFDHQVRDAEGLPQIQDRAVLYAAGDVPTAFAETFRRNRRRIDRARREPWLAAFETRAPLTLLDLGDTFRVRAGASMKLVDGPFSFSQAWARGFHETYTGIDGIRYPSSLTNRPVVALFERADDDASLAETPTFNRALLDSTFDRVIRNLAVEIGYSLV